MDKPDYIASDTHLGAVPRETERAFLRFLEHVGASAGQLLLPGDLFDFWFEWGKLIPGKQFRVLAALAAIVDAGVPVSMVGGNHDAWGGRFLVEEVGMSYTTGMLRMELGGRSTLVAHGDGVGVGDLKYRMLKAVIRSRAAVAGFRFLHPEIGLGIAARVSSTESKADDDPAMKSRSRYIQAWAHGMLSAEPGLELVVCGHSHLPVLDEVAPGRFYLNSGDWVRNRSYAVVPVGGPPELRSWDS
jgi:UDP-2,3-diacylglucosamine hydrolase